VPLSFRKKLLQDDVIRKSAVELPSLPSTKSLELLGRKPENVALCKKLVEDKAKDRCLGENVQESHNGKSHGAVTNAVADIRKRKKICKVTAGNKCSNSLISIKYFNSSSEKLFRRCLKESSSESNMKNPVPVLSSTPSVTGRNAELQNNFIRVSNKKHFLSLDKNLSPSSPGKKCSKHRVSFSDLPPVEYSVSNKFSHDFSEPDANNIDASVAETLEALKIVVEAEKEYDFSASHSLQQDELENWELMSSTNSLAPSNEADHANELLFDILEEIETGNITLSNCLKDLVMSNLLSHDMAQMVYPNYRNLQSIEKNECRPSTSMDETCDFIGKLVDLLTNFDLETLQKCHKLILGKLCQLSSRKDFENAQQVAGSDVIEMPAVTAKDVIDDALNCCGANNYCSDKQSDLKNDKEKRRYLSPDDVMEKSITSDTILTECDTKFDIKEILSKLTDERILGARQVCGIFGAGEEFAQKTLLKKCLCHLSDLELQGLYRRPGLRGLKSVIKEDWGEEKLQSKEPNTPTDSTVNTSDLYGGGKCNESSQSTSINLRNDFCTKQNMAQQYVTLPKPTSLASSLKLHQSKK